jgi:hypothetical protein
MSYQSIFNVEYNRGDRYAYIEDTVRHMSFIVYIPKGVEHFRMEYRNNKHAVIGWSLLNKTQLQVSKGVRERYIELLRYTEFVNMGSDAE